jgi:hypothetical protein
MHQYASKMKKYDIMNKMLMAALLSFILESNQGRQQFKKESLAQEMIGLYLR